MQRKFIEYDLPLEEISEESAREKNIRHGHPSTLHIWWARRPLAASRATTFASLVDDPGPENPQEREEIMELIKDISPWEAVKNDNSKDIGKAQKLIKEQYEGDPPKVLDPFAGGGSIPLESLRLGAEAHASDYNPVAVFIEKATVEWPQEFGLEIEIPKSLKVQKADEDDLFSNSEKDHNNLLYFMVKRWANKVFEDTYEEIGQFFPEGSGAELVGKREISKEEGWRPVGYLWVRTIPCQNPNCDAEIPLIRQYWLAKKKGKKIAYRPVVDEENDKIDFELLEGKDLEMAIEKGFNPTDGTISRANATCLACGQVTEAEKIRSLSKDGEMGKRMITVVYHHPEHTGKKYRLAKREDEVLFKEAGNYLKNKINNWSYIEDPLPREEPDKEDHAVNRLPLYGMPTWKDAFNKRQQLSLVTFQEKIRSSFKNIEKEAEQIINANENLKVASKPLAKAVIGYLGVLLDKLAEHNASLVRWINQNEAFGYVFSRQALPMMWDYMEINPFSLSTGDWKSSLDWILRYIQNNPHSPSLVKSVQQSTATNLGYEDNTLDAVVTDPPYYDNVSYAALSDFFYVWLKRAIGEFFPSLFSTPEVPKSGEAVMETTRHPDKTEAKEFFEQKLRQSFKETHRVLKSGGVFTVVYAHKSTEGWETMLNGLIDAGFVVTASWPVHTERKGRLRAQASASLASSIYMVCRKTERKRIGFWKDHKPKIKERVEEKLKQFWQEGIAGGDLFISAIGPGMEVFSQYEEVQKYSGEKVSTRELLTFIRSITTDFVVNRLLKEASPSEIDKESQFYLAYRWTYLDNKVEYDAARKIASGMGVDIEELDDNYGFVKKTRKYVKVYGPSDRTDYDGDTDEIEINSMVDAMHKSLILWEDGRKDEINKLLVETGYAEQGSFWQFCQAVSESLVQGNDEKKKLEGFLMGRDKYVKSAKEMNEQAEKTKDMFEEE